MDGIACWPSVLRSKSFIFDFDRFMKKKAMGKENQKDMSCRKEER